MLVAQRLIDSDQQDAYDVLHFLLFPNSQTEKISFDKTEQVQSVREGRDALVNCFVHGQPVPEVSWLHNGEYINS